MGKAARGAVAEKLAFADALRRGDAASMGAVLLAALRARNDGIDAVSDLTATQQRGEAFTGGRSTPVHDVTATVVFRGGASKTRAFIAKVVSHEGATERDEFRRASYRNERAFYAAAAAVVGDLAPRCFVSEGNDETTCLILADVRQKYPRNPEVLTDPALFLAAVRGLAAFHAAFFAKSNAATKAAASLFPRGTFWRYDAPGEAARNFSRSWPAALRWLEARGVLATGPRNLLAARVTACASAVDRKLAEARAAHGTVVHGDWKAANLFFDEDAVAAVDFQYAGGGLGAQDLAYFLFPDARGDVVGADEAAVLDAYFDAFSEALAAAPSASSYASYRRGLFLAHYDLARLDFFRHMLGRGWVPSTDQDARCLAAVEATLAAVDGIAASTADLSVHVVARLDYGGLLDAWLARARHT